MKVPSCTVGIVCCEKLAAKFGERAKARVITQAIVDTGKPHIVFYAPDSEFCYYIRVDPKIIANPDG